MNRCEGNDPEVRISTSKKRILAFILGAVIAGLFCAGFIIQRKMHFIKGFGLRSGGDPALVIAASDLNFGRVYETSAHLHRIRITNSTDEPVTISRFLTSCECAGVTPAGGVTLKPHESRPFTLTLSLDWKGDKRGNFGPEPFNVNVAAFCIFDKEALPPITAGLLGLLASPQANGPFLAAAAFHPEGWAGHRDQRTDWRITGEVIPTVRLRTPSIFLGTVSDRKSVIEASGELEASPDIASVICTSDYPWDVSAIRANEDSAHPLFRLAIRSRGKVRKRHVEEFLVVVPVNRQNHKLPSKRIKMVGDIVPDIVPTPPDVHFGRRPIGTVAEGPIILRSLTNSRFTARALPPKNLDLTIAPGRAKDGQLVFSVQLRISKEGSQEVGAEFKIRDAEGTDHTVTLPVRYWGASLASE